MRRRRRSKRRTKPTRSRKRTRKPRRSSKRKGKGMPANVVKYFKLVGGGMSKAEARKKAGLGPKKAGARRKKWGPGNALYEWRKRKGLKV